MYCEIIKDVKSVPSLLNFPPMPHKTLSHEIYYFRICEQFPVLGLLLSDLSKFEHDVFFIIYLLGPRYRVTATPHFTDIIVSQVHVYWQSH